MRKIIFVTGGVCSSLGKGIVASSIGTLMESRGLIVRMVKIDPYLNVDAGTMNPYQHGEVYVTDDGAETDLDLGNYGRFTNSVLGRANSITTGQIYQTVINKEREGRYLGQTVQVVPHITDEIKSRILAPLKQNEVDITIVEVGGTVGDMESIPYLEAARQIIHELGKDNVLSVHVTLVPRISGGELKTKLTQHAVRELQEVGIQPDALVLRSENEMTENLKRKISGFTNVEMEGIISSHDIKYSIYEVPLVFFEQGFDSFLLRKMNVEIRHADLSAWRVMVGKCQSSETNLTIGVIGKYVEHHDSYKSVWEALAHGGIASNAIVDVRGLDSCIFEAPGVDIDTYLEGLDGILVPGGYGQRGSTGMLNVIRWAREHGTPFLGICLGLQMMVIEWARNVAGIAGANSTEFDPKCEHPVITLLADQIDISSYGGTQRLGLGESKLVPGSRIGKIYDAASAWERHRHRYEVSNKYRARLEASGLNISGESEQLKLVESVEWPDHPWGIGVQFHPEFKSKPVKVSPLFAGFVDACKQHSRAQHSMPGIRSAV